VAVPDGTLEGMWFIASGHNNDQYDKFKTGSYLAIGYKLLELRKPLDKEAIKEHYRERNPEKEGGSATSIVPQVISFCDRMRVGEVVITNDRSRRVALWGRVASDWYLETSVDEYRIRRRVVWEPEVSYNALTDDERDIFASRRTVNRVWRGFESLVREFDLMPVDITETDLDRGDESEGDVRYAISRIIERSKTAREKCLTIHGFACGACGINMRSHYPCFPDDFIEVHHRRPMAQWIKENSGGKGVTRYRINPERDLVPLCPNCHSAVHSCKPPMEVEDLRRLLENGAD